MKGERKMLIKPSCLEDERGQPIDTEDEIAYILASTYNQLGGDRIIWRRKMSWIVTGLSLVISIVLSVVTQSPAWLILMIIPAIVLAFAYFTRLKGSIESIRKVHWIAEFRDLENGSILIDKSGLTEPTRFTFPLIGEDLETILNLAGEINRSALDRSVLIPISDETLSFEDRQLPANELETEIRSEIDTLTNIFKNSQDESIDLRALDSHSNITETIIRNIESYTQSEPNILIKGQENRDIEKLLDKLQEVTQLASKEATDIMSIELVAKELIQSIENSLKKLDEVRRTTLVEILAPQLNGLSSFYDLAMLKRYCPKCCNIALGNPNQPEDNDAVEGLDEVNNVEKESEARDSKSFQVENAIRIRAIDELSNQRLESGGLDSEALREQVASFDGVLKTSRLRFSNVEEKKYWYCPLCHTKYDSQAALFDIHVIKDEMVYPLWDILWNELSNERAEIIREKEQERRENLNQELVEINAIFDDFKEEQRLWRSKLNDLRETNLKTAETLTSIINAFDEYDVIQSYEANTFKTRVMDEQSSNEQAISKVQKSLDTWEGDLRARIEEAQHLRAPIIDKVDEVKVKGRFFEIKRDTDEDLLEINEASYRDQLEAEGYEMDGEEEEYQVEDDIVEVEDYKVESEEEDYEVDEVDDEIEFKGTITELEPDLVIGDYTVVINEDTEIGGELAVDSTAEVEGLLQEDGSVLALKIEVEVEEEEEDYEMDEEEGKEFYSTEESNA